MEAVCCCFKQVGENSGYSAPAWPLLYDRTELRECVYSFTLCTQLHAFCHLIGATSESRKSIQAQNVMRVKPDPPSVGGVAGMPD